MKRDHRTERREAKSADESLRSSARAGWLALVALAFLVLAATYWYLKSSREEPVIAENTADHAVTPPEPPPAPSPRGSRYLNTLLHPQYVGSKRCGQCHAEEETSYRQTAHAHSFAAVDPADEPPDGTFDHNLSRRRLRAFRKEGQLWHSEALQLAAGGELPLVERPVKYLVGSGRFARTYLTEVEGCLVESPLSWYSSLKAWRMSPGYDSPRHSSFRRDIDTDCLYCHVGRAETAAGSLSRIALHEMAIGCERCHGPGSIHIQRRRSSDAAAEGEEDLSIVNPSRLTRDLNEAICNQCHLESATSAVVRGQMRQNFRPGLAWNDFVANYGYKEQRENMTVTGHVEQMRASRCYQNSSSLTCTTCHNPHHSPQPDERREHYRAACLSCHDENKCRAPQSERQAKNRDDCAACHMPRSAVEVPHLAFTHHRIGLHAAAQNATQEPAVATAIVPILDVSRFSAVDQQFLLGLAYWRHHAQIDDALLPAASERARELFTRVAEKGLNNGSIAAPLAALALEGSDATLARREAERALADASITPRDRVLASELLAALDVQENRLTEAARLLKQLLGLRPHPQYWFLLGVCRQRQGDLPGATQAFEHVVALDPAEPATYRMLAALYQRRGDADAARRHVERADLLEANLPP